MDSDQELLNIYNVREEAFKAVEWKRKKVAQQRYENAANEAHKIRMLNSLVCNLPVISWDDMDLISKRHLIADAENVANNPFINMTELKKMYQERLTAWGDTNNPDLGTRNENALQVEKTVLDCLKGMLNKSSA